LQAEQAGMAGMSRIEQAGMAGMSRSWRAFFGGAVVCRFWRENRTCLVGNGHQQFF